MALDQVTDGQLCWHRLPDPYDEVTLGTQRYRLRSGKVAFVTALEEQFPEEKEAIREFMRLTKVWPWGHLPVGVACPQGRLSWGCGVGMVALVGTWGCLWGTVGTQVTAVVGTWGWMGVFAGDRGDKGDSRGGDMDGDDVCGGQWGHK